MVRNAIIIAALACLFYTGQAATPAQLFASADQDSNGNLVYGELYGIFSSFDADGSHNVDFSEFLSKWFEHGLGSYQQALAFYNGLDVNNDFIVDGPGDLVGFPFFDTNYDGLISFSEFVSKFN